MYLSKENTTGLSCNQFVSPSRKKFTCGTGHRIAYFLYIQLFRNHLINESVSVKLITSLVRGRALLHLYSLIHDDLTQQRVVYT